MKKEDIVAVSYLDACYFKKGENIPDGFEFAEHVAVGKLVALTDSDITLAFLEKDGESERGLVLPINSLILKDEHISDTKLKFPGKKSIGSDIVVHWSDPVHFQNGAKPESSTVMRSEGELFSVTEQAVVLKDPKTFRQDNESHPKDSGVDIAYLFIPKRLITKYEFYE